MNKMCRVKFEDESSGLIRCVVMCAILAGMFSYGLVFC